MKAGIIKLSLFLSCISAGLYSQDLIVAERNDSVAANQNANHPISFAQPSGVMTETSGIFYYSDYPWVETYGISLALHRGTPFSLENWGNASSMYSPLYHTFNEKPGDFKYSNTFIQYAPGISFFSLNRKYSLDIYKMSNTKILYNGNQIAPVKVNFHF